jgi:hypothetical protein
LAVADSGNGLFSGLETSIRGDSKLSEVIINIDITQALRDTENALRDFVASVLSQSIGPEWIEKCGVTAERIDRWKARKKVEESRQEAGVVDERLIYYADFYDLKTILKKHWSGEFSEALGEWKTMEVWLEELERLRDPDAHRRELLPHQKHLALGIAGEIRARLVRYRSKKETAQDCFPRIESARDSIGNIWIPQSSHDSFFTRTVLRTGDILDYLVTAQDPEDMPLEYGISVANADTIWQNHGEFSIRITEKCIGEKFGVGLFVRSPRSYHAHGTWDHCIEFYYTVLPKK